MWQRFTDVARRSVYLAQIEAKKIGDGYVSTEHLLLGLVQQRGTVATRVLERLGVSLIGIRAEVKKHLSQSSPRSDQDLTLTPRAKRVLDFAWEEARSLNCNYIGTEHLLLALIREGDGLAGRVLAVQGLELEKTRRVVIEFLDPSNKHFVRAELDPTLSKEEAQSEESSNENLRQIVEEMRVEDDELETVRKILKFTEQTLSHERPIFKLEDDRLKFGPAAETLASFINHHETATPLTIAINAPWGSGKTSLTNLILIKLERRLNIEAIFNRLFGMRSALGSRLFRIFDSWLKRQPWHSNQEDSTLRRFAEWVQSTRNPNNRFRHTVCRFNAWMHDDAPQISSAFAEEIVRSASSARHLAAQIFRPVPFKLASRFVVSIQIGMVVLVSLLVRDAVLVAFYLQVFPKGLEQIFYEFGSKVSTSVQGGPVAIIALAGVGLKQIKEIYEPVQKFIRDPQRASQSNLASVRMRLASLFQQATTHNRKFIIFIDDIERCKPENALCLLEVVNQLLSHPNVVVVLSADMELVSASAGIRFKEQAKLLATETSTDTGLAMEYGRKFVRKMVQLYVTIPRPAPEDALKVAHNDPSPPDSTVSKARPDLFSVAEAAPEDNVEESLRQAGATEVQIEKTVEAKIEAERANRTAIAFLTGLGLINPRDVRRTENTLRVAFGILVRNDTVTISEDLAKSVAKWAYLQELAPSLVDWIREEGKPRIESLEATSQSDLEKYFKVKFCDCTDAELVAKLIKVEPPISPDFNQIAYWS